MMHSIYPHNKENVHVTRTLFYHIINVVQRHYSKATTNVNDELEKRFPTQDVMDALGISYYRINFFSAHGIIEKHFLLVKETWL